MRDIHGIHEVWSSNSCLFRFSSFYITYEESIIYLPQFFISGHICWLNNNFLTRRVKLAGLKEQVLDGTVMITGLIYNKEILQWVYLLSVDFMAPYFYTADQFHCFLVRTHQNYCLFVLCGGYENQMLISFHYHGSF